MPTVKTPPAIYVCDFETTVYDNQEYTEVWASACVELNTEDVHIFHGIVDTFEFFKADSRNIIAYYHNLKFDGQFWIAYLLQIGYEQAYTQSDPDNVDSIVFDSRRYMKNNSFTYSISDMGQWYRITIKTNGKYIDIRDSLKLLPFSVKRIGQSFGTKHKKLDMEYTGYRYAGCEITDKEKEYIANDVLVVKEALEIMFAEGHNKLTIGACCLAEFKKVCTHDTKEYDGKFPDLYSMEIDEEQYGSSNAGEYIRMSYHGGWCYVVKGKQGKIFHNGTTADVNSLYPSMMSSESGNVYPTGYPTFWKGNYIPEDCNKPWVYYFIRFRTRFYLKKGKLPFVQIKSSLLYHPREMLVTSDVRNRQTGKYWRFLTDSNGNEVPTSVVLTMTCTDYKLFREHYNVEEFEILDGCWFYAYSGLFDNYIEKYKKIKMENKGAKRELAKLFLNNLYGKMAASKDSSFKVAYMKENDVVGYMTVVANDKKAGYIPVGSAITSYARNFTIRAAQANYHGDNKAGFIYADTDSIHCDLPPDKIKNIKVDDKKFCCWKLESCWDTGKFVRPKTYMEHITHENLNPIDEPYWNIKCAGMPEECKKLFVRSMNTEPITEAEIEKEKWNEEKIKFVTEKRTIDDFDIGLIIPGKLRPKRIKGGIILEETTYEMRDI